jgi:hypothetical protein
MGYKLKIEGKLTNWSLATPPDKEVCQGELGDIPYTFWYKYVLDYGDHLLVLSYADQYFQLDKADKKA